MNIGASIRKMRTNLNISQEKLATAIGVSKQAVQKWETNTATPETKHLITMADFFHVPLDALVFERSKRDYEEITFSGAITPQYQKLHSWESYMKQLDVEYQQCVDEGKDISKYQELFHAVQMMPDSVDKETAAETIFTIVNRAQKADQYPYIEPSSFAEISEFCSGYMPAKNKKLTGKQMEDKIYGAWLGRICGCLLGKPIEGIKKEELTKLLQETGNYPMQRYINASDLSDEIMKHYTYPLKNRCYADTVSCAPVDDDTNYTVLAMKIVKDHGRDFTPEQVGEAWKSSQSVYAYCTAERVAFKNLINGFLPPDSAIYKNPYREWIGAQIRADYYGYINPGNPVKAAEMAWRDACVSHVKNGIYGAMFIAAMLAGAAVCDDIEEIIQIGLGQIPTTSRLHESVAAILSMHRNGKSYADCIAFINEQYDDHEGHHWCHVISNAMIVTTALLYGNANFGQSICLAVQAAFDTDCNGATVGSIIGMLKGKTAIGPEWYAPVHGMLDTSIFGIGKVKIDDLVKETLSKLRK